MDCFKLAAALDPRFKLDWCTEEEFPTVKDLLQQTASSLEPSQQPDHDPDTAPPPHKGSKLFGFMTPRSQVTTTPESPATQEISSYLGQPSLQEDADPLAFWRDNSQNYPLLSQLACRYLGIPASSAPVERLFSVAGKVFRPERCLLSDAHFEQLMCNSK